MPLRRLVSIRSSNVDKVIEEGEDPVTLCNYVDVYYNDRITDQIEFSQGSAKQSEIDKFALRAGDVVITKDSETPDDIAVPALVEPSGEGIVCAYHLAILRPLPKMMNGNFLFWCLNSKPVREAFGIEAQGVTRFGLTLGGMKNVLLPVPDIGTQKLVAEYLEVSTRRLDTIIKMTGGREAAKQSNPASLLALLLEKRAALITAAVTGEIDVREKLPAVTTKPYRHQVRCIVGAEIVSRHQGNPKFGRVKLQKELYLAETHLGISELGGNYLREAAGPLDWPLIEDTEQAMTAAGFYRADQPEGRGTAVVYTALAKAGEYKADLDALLGERADALRNMIDKLRDLDSKAIEAVATLYAVWNDALIDGDTPSEDAIINGVLTDWHVEKSDKFRRDDLAIWLGWMRRHELVPRGEGPRTSPTMIKDMFS